MNKLLLDSHILIWILYEPQKISKKTQDLIIDSDSVFISMASIWELAIKHYKGRLGYSPKEFLDEIEKAGMRIVRVEPAHILGLEDVKADHGDPFDRMLLSQAKIDNLSLLTADREMLNLDLDYLIDARL